MKMINKCQFKKGVHIYIWILFIVYLVYGTGVFSDDYVIPYFTDLEKKYILIAPVNLLIREPFFQFIKYDNYYPIELAKITVLICCFICFQKFFSIFLEAKTASLISLFVCFFPIHDAATFWFTGQSYLLSGSIYFLAYTMFHNKRLKLGFVLAFVASFIGYGSTPFALALAYLALRKMGAKNAFLLFLPNFIYIIYYIFVTKFADVGIDRLPDVISVMDILRNFAMQLLTGADAIFGPSMLLKVYYSILDISIFSMIIVAALFIFLHKYRYFVNIGNNRPDIDLIVALSLLMMFSFGMFAVAGNYPQISFNLGNRVTLWGSFLFVYLLFSLTKSNKYLYTATTLALLLSVAGASDHLKNWGRHQNNVVNNIRNVGNFIDSNEVLFVYGSRFSELGPFSHFEFLNNQGYTRSVFFHALKRNDLNIFMLNSGVTSSGTIITDPKAGVSALVNDIVQVYDADKNILISMSGEDLMEIKSGMTQDKRHWIQFVPNETIAIIINLLAPKYKNIVN